VDGKNHHFVFVGMFTLDGLYGQPNSGLGGNLQRTRRMTNPLSGFQCHETEESREGAQKIDTLPTPTGRGVMPGACLKA
jgi:hypothetical protein